MIIIPARLASTRFPNKILCEIDGIPMFVKTALNASKISDVAVACDDEKVLKIAKKYGLEAVLTASNHQSGTDRINEAAKILALGDNETIINVQADEPFFEEENLKQFLEFTDKTIASGSFMTSCYKKVEADDAKDPNLVKVVLDEDKNALYFSRSLIPYPREDCKEYLAHIGIYGYSTKTINEFCLLKTNYLENIEKLEQLRALRAGKRISMLEIETKSIGIDTKEDYLKASKIYNFKAKI